MLEMIFKLFTVMELSKYFFSLSLFVFLISFKFKQESVIQNKCCLLVRFHRKHCGSTSTEARARVKEEICRKSKHLVLISVGILSTSWSVTECSG